MGVSPGGESYNFEGRGIPLLNGPTEFGLTYPECTLYTTESKRTCKMGDLILCVRGSTTGRMNWADKLYSLGRGVCAIRGENVLATKYIRYCLEGKLEELLLLSGGSTFPNLTRDDIGKFKIPYPSTRYKIASILSAYDDLIENNTRRIKILEQMAHTIYKEWFINFRFPGHENTSMVESELGLIPEGWEVKNVFDIAEVIYGFPFKSKLFTEKPDGKPVIRIRDILNNKSKTFTSEEANNKYLVCNGDILIGMDGDFHMGKWAGGEAYLNQRIVRLRPKNGLSSYYLFLALRSPIQLFNSTIVGTTVTHLSDKDLHSINLIIPDNNFSNMVKDVFDTLFNLEILLHLKNANLRHTRELLLPKFVSGEIDVEILGIGDSIEEKQLIEKYDQL